MTPERADHYCRLVEFVQSLIDPEQFGWSVTDEVRQMAREALKRSHTPQVLEPVEPE